MIRAFRWIAIGIAVAAAIDPSVPMPRSERPAIRVVSPEPRDVSAVATALKKAGFVVDPAAQETAVVLIGASPAHAAPGAAPSGPNTMHSDPRTVMWALDTSPPAPNVRVVRADGPAVRLPAQAVEVRATLTAVGVGGETTEVVLEHAGLPVASVSHTWSSGETEWQASLRYLPPDVTASALRVRATGVTRETTTGDNVADVAVPAVRGPVRVLVIEAAVTWPAVFVRRALEGETAIAVSSLQRAAKSVATRAGDPPAALTRGTLAPFEAIIVGGPDDLRAGDLDAIRWFIEERGGVAVFIPDRAPAGRYVDLVGVPGFTSRVLEAPVRLGSDLRASELLVPRQLPAASTVLAADNADAVVFSARRGAGAVAFSGALDAWRHRGDAGDANPAGVQPADDPYARFWRGWLIANAAAIPPAVDVAATPAILRPGERTRLVVRLRDVPSGDRIVLPPVSARVIGPETNVDEPVRLWPTAEPGVYEGEWRGRRAGRYDVSVTAGDLRGDAAVTIAAQAVHGSAADPDALRLVTSASGGRVFPIDEVPALVDAMQQAHPPRPVVRQSHPMRSPWWLVPFAGLLCAEWAVRRKRGLP